MLNLQAPPRNAVSLAAAHLVDVVEGDAESTRLALMAILATTERLRALLWRLRGARDA